MFENKDRTDIETLGEFGLIDHITKHVKINHKNTVKGVGDDAAVISIGNGKVQVVTTDLLTEGIHFDLHILQLIGSLWHEFGISVVICSHLLHDVDRICDRVIIVVEGRVRENDTLETLKSRRRRTVEVAPSSEGERFVTAFEASGVSVERLSNGRLRVPSETESTEWLLTLMRDGELPPAEIFASPNALHELFIQSLAIADHG